MDDLGKAVVFHVLRIVAKAGENDDEGALGGGPGRGYRHRADRKLRVAYREATREAGGRQTNSERKAATHGLSCSSNQGRQAGFCAGPLGMKRSATPLLQ